MNPADVNAIFRTFQEAEPEPKTELEYTNPFTLLVAIVLSAQSTDAGVNKATRALFKVADTPQKMVGMGEEKLADHIKSVNFFRTKAKNVVNLSHLLIEQWGGDIPRDAAALQTLPGVGRKTANVWLNSIHGELTIGVDTHVHRVANRLGLCHTANAAQTEEALMRVVPDIYKTHAHHWLILHGRYTCKAKQPECWRCIVYRWCQWEGKEAQRRKGEALGAESSPNPVKKEVKPRKTRLRT